MENFNWWLLGAYVAGTGMGILIAGSFAKIAIYNATSVTIDTLIENGFLRSRTTEDGEIELIKYDEV